MKNILLLLLLSASLSVNAQDDKLTSDDYVVAGIIQMDAKNYGRAIEYFTKAIFLNEKNHEAYCERGSCKGLLNDYDGAFEDFNAALKIYPAYPMAFYKRGLTKYQTGDKVGACEDWQTANKNGSPYALKYIFKYCK